MKNKIFYRVANIETNQGLWYNWNGNFTGLIHNEFNFCKNTNLPMPFDKELIGWLSATESLEDLWIWFPKKDVYRLQKHGWYVYTYLATKWKSYENHQVIDKDTSIALLKLEINDTFQIKTLTQVNKSTESGILTI